MILAGDVGGTKTRLAIFETDNGLLVERDLQSFVSSDFSGLEEIVQVFLKGQNSRIESVCLGVPGPVRDGEVFMRNLGWELKEKDIADTVSTSDVRLVNDLVATAAALPYLTHSQLMVLHQGKPLQPGDTCAILAPGTGLGQSFLTWSGDRSTPYPTEGGHGDFAPCNDCEIELLRFLRHKFDRVSYERVLSGPGLVNIYDFLKSSKRAVEPEALALRLKAGDSAAIIANAGLQREFEICTMALDIFTSILGAEAANLVLRYLAVGGIYLGGGIPPKIIEKLMDGTLVKSYLNKGRLTRLVEDTSLYLIKDDHAALIGAGYLAIE